jgi:AcrR family transcriptional regulator
MSLVEPTAPNKAPSGGPGPEGLRERKKRLMRQQLSDTATEMFVQRGFDAVRVAEVAQACGVSEKTVFNYFPTKESLVMDRLDATMDAVRTGFADPAIPPVQAALRILADELAGMTSWLAAQADPILAGRKVQQYGNLIRTTPSLRAHQHTMLARLIALAAGVLAERVGLAEDDPEPQIAATALIGLWQIHFRALRKYLDGTRTPDRVHRAVTADVRRAAGLIESGLRTFGAGPGPAQPPPPAGYRADRAGVVSGVESTAETSVVAAGR